MRVDVGALLKKPSISPFARQESYMTLYLFPLLLPNAPFGIVDRYLDPRQGLIGTLYLHPRHKAMTTGLYLSKIDEHFVQSQSRVMQ